MELGITNTSFENLEGLKMKTPLIPTDFALCRRDYVQYPDLLRYGEIQFLD
jgi:D-alanyl-D-alanine carboxypeptidase